MRSFASLCTLLLVGAACAAGEGSATAPASQSSGVDLKNNVLVQKALTDQDKAMQEVEADFNKKLEALKAERQKKVDVLKKACVDGLRRAAAVAEARNNKDEALTIRALADTIAAEISPTEPAKKIALTLNPTESVKGTIIADSGKYPITLFGSGRVAGPGVEGVWENKNGLLVITWKHGMLDTFQLRDSKELLGRNKQGAEIKLQLER